MRTLLKFLGFALLAVVLLIAGGALFIHLAGIPTYTPQKVEFPVDVTPERIARGQRTVTTLCAGCHMNPETGVLTGKRMADAPPQFGEVYSRNITQDPEFGIGQWTDGELAYLLRTGVTRDGRYTPPWMVKLPHMSDEDLGDVIAFLRSDDPLVRPAKVPDRDPKPSFFAKFLTRVAFLPLPYPKGPIAAPPASDKVAYGRYLVTGKLDCYACHSKDFATVDVMEPERTPGYLGGGNNMRNEQGQTVYTANISPDLETGIGKWTEEQFHRTMRTGLRPDGRVLRYPMLAMPELTDEEMAAVWAYIRSVPAVKNAVPASEPAPVVASADAGKRAYYMYGCNQCHGDTGIGVYDLRKGVPRYPTNEALIAYIKHPERTRPGIKMPTWDGVIEESEYPALAAYVRTLAGS